MSCANNGGPVLGTLPARRAKSNKPAILVPHPSSRRLPHSPRSAVLSSIDAGQKKTLHRLFSAATLVTPTVYGDGAAALRENLSSNGAGQNWTANPKLLCLPRVTSRTADNRRLQITDNLHRPPAADNRPPKTAQTPQAPLLTHSPGATEQLSCQANRTL